MKKFFAFAIAIVAMATSMVSCNNDNTDFIEQKAPEAPTNTIVEKQNPQEMMDISLVVAVTKQQQKYFDETYVVKTPGHIQTVMLFEMEPATQKQIEAFTSASSYVKNYGEDEVEFYAYNLGKVNSADDAKIMSHTFEAKLNHPAENFSYINVSCFIIDGKEFKTISTDGGSKSAPGNDDELKELAKIISKKYN